MRTPKEILEEYIKYSINTIDVKFNTIYVDTALMAINKAQIEAYNQAISDIVKNNISSKQIYEIEKDQDEWDKDSLWCNMYSILKLKK